MVSNYLIHGKPKKGNPKPNWKRSPNGNPSPPPKRLNGYPNHRFMRTLKIFWHVTPDKKHLLIVSDDKDFAKIRFEISLYLLSLGWSDQKQFSLGQRRQLCSVVPPTGTADKIFSCIFCSQCAFFSKIKKKNVFQFYLFTELKTNILT